jgi:DNA modification methylase
MLEYELKVRVENMMVLGRPLYTTEFGAAYVGDSLELLDHIESESIDLVVTSPPFALQREKSYGNVDQTKYVDWLFAFCEKVYRILAPRGSFVLDLDFRLAEEFFWHNPAKLPSPIEWVNKRKLRAKDSVNTIWWLSKNDNPKADITRVLVPYSERMKKLQRDPDNYYKAKLRPSGHDIGKAFASDNGGAIPSNLLQIPNTESNSRYIQLCKAAKIAPHPARFPQKLPSFFIEFLTDPGDVVLDIFAGSNTTGFAAEELKRKWIAFEKDRSYLAASALRFVDTSQSAHSASLLYARVLAGTDMVQVQRASQLSLGALAD